MTDREDDFNRTAKDSEGRKVQQELERQLRELGDTMSDSFRHGFEGRGEEIGDRVWDVGRAAVNAAGYGISEAGRAFQAGKQEYQKRAEEARNSASASGMTDWARNFFAKKPEPTAIENIRTSAKKRHSAGVAMLATGITFAVIFGITAIACFGTAGAFTSGGVIVAADMTVLSAIGDLALGAIAVTGWCSAAVTAVFGWLTAAGASRMKAAKTLELYAGEIIMVGGYYLYAALLLGKSFAGAAASVPGNLVQGAFGLVCGVVIIKIIAKTRVLNKFSTYAVQ